MAPRLATQQSKGLSSNSTTTWDAYTTPGPPLAQRPPAVVTTSWSRPVAGHLAGDLPRTHAGPVSICSVPCSPATQPAPWPWTSTRVGPAARRPRSREAGQAAALGSGRPSCEPATATVPSSLPVRPDAGMRPRRPPTTGLINRLDPTGGGSPHRATPGSSAAQTARRQRRGHRRPVRPDTWMPWTPDPWTLDVRSTGWTDVPAAEPRDADRATTGLAGVRTSSRPAATRDGSAVAAPAPRP
jgi:hypothetical protein